MTLTLAIIGHLVGDYLLQNDWMALNKKNPGNLGGYACIIHSVLWTFSVCLFAGWPLQGWVTCTLFITHFIQDRTTIIAVWMDLIGQYKFRTGPCAPWSIIVVDNVWHIVTLWAVWRFVA